MKIHGALQSQRISRSEVATGKTEKPMRYGEYVLKFIRVYYAQNVGI